MTNHKLVSVAIPAYKAKYLSQAIESVLNQTHQNLEIIVVNDQSPDDIGTIVQKFDDSRIHYYVNERNLGRQNPAYNWNRCLSYAHGEFFALLCDDDLYEPTFIERMLSLAEKHPTTNVFRSRANFINAQGKEINRYPSAPEWESWDDYLWHVSRNYRTQTISEWMYRKAILDQVGGYALLPLAWYADYLSIFRFAQSGGIASTSDILVHFRQSGDNISSQDDKNTLKKVEASRMYRSAVADLLTNHPDRDNLLGGLDWLLNLHLTYNLEHAPKKLLLSLLIHKSQFGIRRSLIRHALWHKAE